MLDELLKESEKLRPGFTRSLGYTLEIKRTTDLSSVKIPEPILECYRYIDGTPHQVSDQVMMDFIPNYRFIHRSELDENIVQARKLLSNCFPFLADYSGNFFCMFEGSVIAIDVSDPTPTLVYKSFDDFLYTQIRMYIDGVYFLDEYGFLNADENKEDIIGKSLNPECSYWLE